MYLKILITILKNERLWIELIKNLKFKKLLSKAIPTPSIKKTLHNYSLRFNSEAFAWKIYCK